MSFAVTVERDRDGVFVAEGLAIPGCVSQGATRNAALLQGVKKAILECLEARARNGMPLIVAIRKELTRGRRGKASAAVVSISERRVLERLEDYDDVRVSGGRLTNPEEKRIAWAKVRKSAGL